MIFVLVEDGREGGEVGCAEQAVKGGSFVNRAFFGGRWGGGGVGGKRGEGEVRFTVDAGGAVCCKQISKSTWMMLEMVTLRGLADIERWVVPASSYIMASPTGWSAPETTHTNPYC